MTEKKEAVKKNDLPVISKKAEVVQRKDFVELKYTGYSNGEVFDSNIEEDVKKISPDEKPRKTIISVGSGMIVKGLDDALEGKETGREYEIEVGFNDGFGERRRELVKTIPLRAFTEKKVEPRAGMVLALDDTLVKILAVSGARVITDFNNPLAGKILKYKFVIVRKVEDIKEKIEATFEVLFRFVPEFEIKDKIVVKGPKVMEGIIKVMSSKFKELVGKELGFEEKKEEKKKDTKK